MGLHFVLREIEKQDHAKFEELFQNAPQLELLIRSTIIQKKGIMWEFTSNYGNKVYLITSKFISALVGELENEVDYSPILDKMEKHSLIVADQEWIELARKYFGFRFIEKPHARFAFDQNNLSIDHLKNLKRQYLDKYNYSNFSIRMINTDDKEKISSYMMEHFEYFLTLDELVHSDLAHIVINNEGNIVSISAAAHPPISQHYEVQIVTERDFRKQGLSMIVTITHLIESLERGYHPHWDAASELSANIAEKLGYGKPKPYSFYSFTTTFIQILRKSRIPKVIVRVLQLFGALE